MSSKNTCSRSSEQSEPAALKEEGNLLFKSGKVTAAFLKYNEAYTKLSSSSNDDSGGSGSGSGVSIFYQRAVLLSNRSNCLFELGRYGKSLADARKCLEFLESIDNTACSSNDEEPSASAVQSESLKRKNLLRIARCGIYGEDIGKVDSTAYIANVFDPLQCLAKCGDAAYEKRAMRMLDQARTRRELILERNSSSSDCSTPPLPSIHRASLYGSSISEYYNYGHDVVTSALESGFLTQEDCGEPACPAIELSKLPEEHLSNLALLFGGVGDARHVYTTLCDVYNQWDGLSKGKKNKFQLNMAINDINPTALARDVLMISALVRLGRLAPDYEDCSEDPRNEAFHLATLVQYTFFGYANPDSVHNHLMDLIDELIEEDFASLKEFMVADDEVWVRVKDTMCYWRSVEEGKDSFPTTAQVLDDIFQPVPDVGSCYAVGSDEYNRVQEVKSGHNEKNYEKKQQMLSDLDSLTLENFDPDTLDTFRSQLPPSEHSDDKLLAAMKKVMRENIENTDANELKDVRSGADTAGRSLDKMFILDVNAILPPKGCAGPLYDQIEDSRYQSSVWKSLFQKAKVDVRSSWKVNRTMFDPLWTIFFDGVLEKNVFNPIAEIGSYFLHAHGVLEYVGTDLDEIRQMDFFGCTSLFFWSVSRAFTKLLASGSIRFELNFGSITQFCRTIQDTTPHRKFHRILLSNVPDYVGFLSVFTEIAPLLHRPTKVVPTFIQCNVLSNCGIWQSYSHYIYSATGISTCDEAAKVLGLRYLNYDSVWAHQNQWTWANKDRPQASRDEVIRWLHRVLLFSLAPPMRDPYGPTNEQCTTNFATFMRVCVFCVEALRYPSHWIGGILDDIISACSTGVLKTTEEFPTSSPVTYHERTKLDKIDITSFRVEIASQIGVWAGHFSQSLVPLAAPRASSYRKYRLILGSRGNETPYLKLCGRLEKCCGAGGRHFTMCLGFVLSDYENPDGADLFSEFPPFSRDYFPRTPEMGKGKIRSSAIKGTNSLQIFSCMTFNGDVAEQNYFIEFFMNENDFQQYSNYNIYVFRSDSWNQIGCHVLRDVMRLRDAELVQW